MKAFMEAKEATLARHGADACRGLSDAQVREKQEQYGRNVLSKEAPPSLAKRILEAASEPMIIMLIAAAVITLVVNVVRSATGGEGDFLECVGIFAAISLSVVITVIMEGRSAKAFEALNKINADRQVKVIRNGKSQMILQNELAVGDIVCVETGDKLAADGRLIESVSLYADESPLTGESLPVEKDSQVICTDPSTPVAERINMLYAGSFITGGYGRMVVDALGDQSEFGQIAKELAVESRSLTPLQEKMAKLGKSITLMGVVAAAIVFLLQLALFILHGTVSLETVSEAFITSIVLIVAAVPEGLPTIVAVSLAVQVIKMSKQNALVKKMIACETVGCINVICSDKTGTLTENRMTVIGVETKEGSLEPEAVKDEHLLLNFCLNSTADIHREEDSVIFLGNPTECALLVAAEKAGWHYEAVRQEETVSLLFPFSSEAKNMTTVVEQAGTSTAYSKGNPEKVLDYCIMEEDVRARIEAKMTAFQENACRVIAFAHKSLGDAAQCPRERQELEKEMIFDGFVAITDPLRAEVSEAVERCRCAGIDLKILTGDNLITASAIAEELHLLDEAHIAIEARQLEELSDQEFSAILPKVRVIARSTPLIKMRVVKTLKAMSHVVAVTGDGINDAPAIKHADVGVAMGISGTEVSKEASDIVLLDDSFATIVKAVQWGRGIYENFQRFIQFQLTVNVASVVTVIACLLSGFAAPFTALQLLWINIIMDGPPALTLGLEPIRGDLMDRQPISRNDAIISRPMLSRIFFNALYISLLFMLQRMVNFLGGAEEQLPTVLFTLFVVCQLFNSFNSRELTDVSIFCNLRNNQLMLFVVCCTFVLQIVITQWGGAFFRTVPLPFILWVKIIVTAASVILVSELIKLIKRRRAQQSGGEKIKLEKTI